MIRIHYTQSTVFTIKVLRTRNLLNLTSHIFRNLHMEKHPKTLHSSIENRTYKTEKRTPKSRQMQKMKNVPFQKFYNLLKNTCEPLYKLVLWRFKKPYYSTKNRTI